MKPPGHPPLLTALGGATLLTVIACGVQWLLWPHIPSLLWLLFYPAVYISSWIWGLYAGATASMLSVVLVWWLFVPPGNPLHNGGIPTLIFMAMSAMFAIGHESLRKTKRRLQILFAQSADAIIVAEPDGRCEAANAAACQLLGYEHGELLTQSIFNLTVIDDAVRLRQALAALQHGGSERLELTLTHQSGSLIPVELSTNSLPEGQWLFSLRDISQRKSAEQTLLQMRAELLEAQRLGKIGSWKWNRLTDILEWSPELYRIYEQDASKPPPSVSALESMYTPESKIARDLALTQALQTGHPYEAERELILHSGQSRWLNITVEGLPDEQGVITTLRGTAQDITERKLVELELLDSRRELRDVAAYREQEREQERKAISREIHDELGQLLAAMRMDVSQLHVRCHECAQAGPIVKDLNSLVERTFEVVRSLATSLRPAALDLGLGIALEWLVEDFSLRWDIPCKLTITGTEVKLDDMRATTIFRVIQESLTNIAKHAQASQVEISLVFKPMEVGVAIQDNGQGFNHDEVAQKRNHFGLIGMRERVWAQNGQIDITSQPGRGTRIAINVPLASDIAIQP